MEQIDLEGQKRTSLGSGASRRFRRQGQVPAVIYGHGDPLPILVGDRDFEKILNSDAGRSSVLNVTMEGTGETVIIRDVQRHPVSKALSHIDLLRVSLDEVIETTVDLEIVGTSPAVKDKTGVLVQMIREVEIQCTPLAMPDVLEVDISKMVEVGDAIHVGDIPLSEGITMLTDVEVTVLLIQQPRVEEVTEVAVEGETAEPEVAPKGKAAEEDEESKE